jgi:hypothetical protein
MVILLLIPFAVVYCVLQYQHNQKLERIEEDKLKSQQQENFIANCKNGIAVFLNALQFVIFSNSRD